VKTKVSPAIVGAFVIGRWRSDCCVAVVRRREFFCESRSGFVVLFRRVDPRADSRRAREIARRADRPRGRSQRALRGQDELGERRGRLRVEQDKVTDPKGNPINVTDRGELQTLVDRGLRAQLGVQGYATGLLFVELGFYNPRNIPPRNTSPR